MEFKWFRKLIGVVAVLSLVTVGVLYAEENSKININTATIQELTQLDRVGEKYAERIVAYRNEHGMFKTAEDIMKVQGIGPKIWELNKDRIIVGETGENIAKAPEGSSQQ